MHGRDISHVDLVVSSIERSLPFYRELLAPLGFHGVSEVEGERGETIHYLGGPTWHLGLREPPEPPAHGVNRYELGLHHLCFNAPTRGAVDAAAVWLRDHEAEIESGPQEYAYSPGYYAVFFYDPDGIKLEIAHVPGLAA